MVKVEFSGSSITFLIDNEGRLNFLVADNLKSEIEKWLNEKANIFILDLQGIHFIDSYSYSILLMLNELLDKAGKVFYLVNISDGLSELFELVGLDKVLRFFTDGSRMHINSA